MGFWWSRVSDVPVLLIFDFQFRVLGYRVVSFSFWGTSRAESFEREKKAGKPNPKPIYGVCIGPACSLVTEFQSSESMEGLGSVRLLTTKPVSC